MEERDTLVLLKELVEDATNDQCEARPVPLTGESLLAAIDRAIKNVDQRSINRMDE